MVVRAVSGYSRMFQVNHVHVVGVGVFCCMLFRGVYARYFRIITYGVWGV